jgi:membrane-anchored glycerophosphoryl diester phosphodiesterase (GDPDase)
VIIKGMKKHSFMHFQLLLLRLKIIFVFELYVSGGRIAVNLAGESDY